MQAAVLLVIIIWNLFYSAAGSYSLPQSQYDALESLYNATNGDFWIYEEPYSQYGLPWNFSSPDANPCLWQGVSCSPNCGTSPCSVYDIVLSTMGLYGTIPGTLVDLPDLRYLLLTSNFIYGQIPVELGSLANLRGLFLEDNWLTGSPPPYGASLAGSLQAMYLYENYLTGPLPPEWGQLSSLQYLAIGGNAIDGPIPQTFGNLSSLAYLDVSHNLLSGQFPNVFTTNTTPVLNELVVAYNQLTGTMPDGIWFLESFNFLSAPNNQFHGRLPDPDDAGWSLVEFEAYDNQFTGPIPKSFINSQLANIDLHQNYLSSSIPAGLFNCSQLTEFLIYNNFVTGTIPPLSNLSHLIYLDVGVNRLNGSIPASVVNASNLIDLWLDANLLTGTLPAELSQLTSLVVLQLGNNTLTGTIPASLDRLQNLQALELLLNRLTGTIPASIAALSQLTVVDFKGNRLNGTIPRAIGNLTYLSYLYLSSNALTGTIPPELGNLTDLIELWLNSNLLEGTIPSSLGRLTKVQELWMYGNYLTGSLPVDLANATAMQQFEIDRNFLTGTIPVAYGNWSALTIFGGNSNRLTGTLPASFGHCVAFYSMVVNNNHLTGTIPAAFRSLAHIDYLSLYSNFLSGTIPDELLTNMTRLTSLWLYDNVLQGPLPRSLPQARALAQLYVQQNVLSGSLPATLAALNKLQYAMFYQNALTGTLPAAVFAAWPALEYFSIYANFLHGAIPATFAADTTSTATATATATDAATLLSLNFDQNYFSQSIPEALISNGRLLSFSASLNCLSGSLSSGWCANAGLTTLVLDGIHASPHCSRPVFSLDPNSAYLVSRAFSGTIPPCLFAMPQLQTLHLSGNNLFGTLPSVTAAAGLTGGVLQYVDVSHNALTGSVPVSVWAYPFVQLDISFNRLTGTIPAHDVFNYSALPPPSSSSTDSSSSDSSSDSSAQSVSLSAQVNRLSGVLPAAWATAPNINVLEGNMFSCEAPFSAQTQHLPTADPNASRYQCGSMYTNYALLMALVFGCVVVATFVAVWTGALERCRSRWCRRGPHEPDAAGDNDETDTLHHSLRAAYHALSPHTSIALRWPHLATWATDMREFLRVLSLLTTLLWLLGVPLYASLSAQYGTYTLQYVWSISLTFIGGETAALSLWCFLVLLLDVLLGYAQLWRPSLWREHFLAPERLWKAALALRLSLSPSGERLTRHPDDRLDSVADTMTPTSTTTPTTTPTDADEAKRATSATQRSLSASMARSSTWSLWQRSTSLLWEPSPDASSASTWCSPRTYLWCVRMACVLANAAIVLTVNAAYIVAIETQPSFVTLTLLSVVVSLFKVLWNNSVVCNNALGQWILQATTAIPSKPTAAAAASVSAMLFDANVQVLLVVSNNILAPLIAAQVVSSSCFQYAVTRPPELQLDLPSGECYFYEYNVAYGVLQNFSCLSIDTLQANLGQTVSILDTVSTGEGGAIAFYPGFMYNFQCSSALLQAFMYIFVLRFLFSAGVMPLGLLAIKTTQEWVFRRTCQQVAVAAAAAAMMEHDVSRQSAWFRWWTSLLPPILRPVTLPRAATPSASSVAVSMWRATNAPLLRALLPPSALTASSVPPLSVDEAQEEGDGSDDASRGEQPPPQRSSSGPAAVRDGVASHVMLYLAKTLRVRIVSDVAVWLSFGVLFPPLAVLVLLAVIVDVAAARLMLGHLLCLTHQATTPSQTPVAGGGGGGGGGGGDEEEAAAMVGEESELARLCVQVATRLHRSFHRFYSKLWRGVATVSYLAALLWGFALFDVLGNAVGTTRSLWVLLVTWVAPLWLTVVVNPSAAWLVSLATSQWSRCQPANAAEGATGAASAASSVDRGASLSSSVASTASPLHVKSVELSSRSSSKVSTRSPSLVTAAAATIAALETLPSSATVSPDGGGDV